MLESIKKVMKGNKNSIRKEEINNKLKSKRNDYYKSSVNNNRITNIKNIKNKKSAIAIKKSNNVDEYEGAISIYDSGKKNIGNRRIRKY